HFHPEPPARLANSADRLPASLPTRRSSDLPVSVSNISTATAVAGGGNHTCARLSDSTLRCWGDGSSGQLGNNKAKGSNVPVTVTDRKSTRLNFSHEWISYAVFCLKKKTKVQ